MAPLLTEVADIQLPLTTDERLSWPGWLTYSGRFTHINGHPSATGRAWDRESSPAKDPRFTAVPHNQCRQCLAYRNRTPYPFKFCHFPLALIIVLTTFTLPCECVCISLICCNVLLVVWRVSRRKLKKAIGTACIGGGMGIAVLLEAVWWSRLIYFSGVYFCRVCRCCWFVSVSIFVRLKRNLVAFDVVI